MLPIVLVPALAIAVAVLICDGLPVFFWQRRVGRYAKEFCMPKYRTMAEGNGRKEDRVTRLGRVLRRHRLDELPQLLLALTGRMSLIGPRPELPEMVGTYGRREMRRLVAKPGLTGLWQVLGGRDRAIHKQLRFDLYYVRRATLFLDLWILLLTVWFVIAPRPSQI
jgi:lipopolysaccharide/colanic/teichoic acid biosynthesis glycosyltransferase